MKIRLLVVSLGISFVAFSSTAAQKCLEYEPTAVTLTGSLYSKVFPGPPNYESIRHGDRKETAIILKLARPTCTTGETMGMDGSHTGLRRMQLVIYNANESIDKRWWKRSTNGWPNALWLRGRCLEPIPVITERKS